MLIPRNEYPRPQFVREKWENLNGEWQFEIDNGRSGESRGFAVEGYQLKDKIIVPFCPESKLSGIQYTDFMYGVWYKRSINIERKEGRIILHFGAVDWYSEIYVNGVLVGEHKGGYDPFSFDITPYLKKSGKQTLCVKVKDATDNGFQPRGKQVNTPTGLWYTPVSGIWQTVWIESLPKKQKNRLQNSRLFAILIKSSL